MLITIFAKKRTSREGKPFTAYLTRLTKKDGTTITTGVRFREDCGAPKAEICPCNIEVDKTACNFNSKEIGVNEDGVIVYSNTLWVSAWKKSATEYRDSSMDEFV